MHISFIHISLFNYADLNSRRTINADVVCLKKKVVIKRSGAVKVVAQYIGDISFSINQGRRTCPATSSKKGRRETNFFFFRIIERHVHVYITFLRTNALRDLTRRNARAVFIWHCISLTVLNTPSFI